MKRLLVWIALLLLLAGCAGGDALDGSRWQLADLNGSAPMQDTELTLEFLEGNMGGRSGCNSFGAAYVTRGRGGIEFEPIAMTAMACVDESGNIETAIMDQEAAYLQALQAARRFRIDGDTLTLLDDADTVLLTYTRLPDPGE
jgi:heat shock protein HslJ